MIGYKEFENHDKAVAYRRMLDMLGYHVTVTDFDGKVYRVSILA